MVISLLVNNHYNYYVNVIREGFCHFCQINIQGIYTKESINVIKTSTLTLLVRWEWTSVEVLVTCTFTEHLE